MAKFKSNGEFIIQHNIPVPPRNTGRKRMYKYQALLANMGKGDSVLLTLSQTQQIRKAAKEAGIIVTCRRVTAGDDYRVWRMS